MERPRKIIVTGASSGIGYGTAEFFLNNKDEVAIVGRNKEALEELHQRFPKTSHVIIADVSVVEDCKRIIEESIEKLGSLDILINNAGILGNVGNSIETTTLEQWETVMNTNLRSSFLITQYAIPHLEKTKGNIVNVSSLSALRAFKNLLPYCVSKAALDQLTRCAALELAPKGIRVNCVNPGTVQTEVHIRGGMNEETYENYLEESKSTHPLGRIGSTEDVVNVIDFLSSSKASWVTGQQYAVDGGRNLVCSGGKSLFDPKK